MPDGDQNASHEVSDRQLLLDNRYMLSAIFEMIEALAKRLTGEQMIVAIGDPSSKTGWYRAIGSQSVVWESDEPRPMARPPKEGTR